MAERRMFAKTIIDSDAFLDMPLSTQALYFHLSMRADDEGFINNPKKIQRMIGASDDDIKVLISKRFIIPFESGIVVIKHWRIHNYIRADRLVDTKYTDERRTLIVNENGAYSICDDIKEVERLSATDARKKAYEDSSLPYSFSYKIKRAFDGHICPMCGVKMTSACKTAMPTIQHNIPISKGGVHELENISIICESCNTSTKDKETDKLNNAEVIEMWDRITLAERQKIKWFDNPSLLDTVDVSQMSVKCQSDVGQMSAQDRIGKDRLGKDSNYISSYEDISPSELSDDEPKHVLQDVVDKWNELTAFGITKVRFISAESPRHKYVRARIKQYGRESFDEVVENIKNSDFLQGKSNSKRPFLVDFDWVIKPSNYPKVLEGKYNNRDYSADSKANDNNDDGWQT